MLSRKKGSWELGFGGRRELGIGSWGLGKKRMGVGRWGGGGNEGESAIVLDTYLQYCYLGCKLRNERTSFTTQHAVVRKLAREHS
uniref:Uncharacterized protein n=1 Tax=Desertifilum tharense IPPAS B-1220 TaxID=1781255 RepID=A0ACD5GMJ4_9CYAN